MDAGTPSPSGRARELHWDAVYGRQGEEAVSWFEAAPTVALELFGVLGVTTSAAIIDVGAGASRLVDALVARGSTDLTLLDVSDEGLGRARRRLGADAARIEWIVADLLSWRPERRYRVWHDRAVFHFLTDPQDQARYRELLDQALQPDAQMVVGTFAADGPEQCSGLPTARYDAEALATVLGPGVTPVAYRRELHETPWGAVQPFTWMAARRP